ncbi:MAG: hypothetical protein FH751_16945 [Firmicutes bacterium]|nr:hypothetical protein [Bacillota bacterium]
MADKTIKLIKNIVIGFFILIFVMGFFSKTIISLFLPKVNVAGAASLPVEKTLRLDGKVKPREEYQVRIGGNVIIDKFFVEEGDSVFKGDPIFKIDTSYGVKGSDEDVEELKFQLERAKIRLENLTNEEYSVELKNLKILKGDIKKAKENIEKLKRLYEADAISKSNLTDAKDVLRKLETSLEIKKLQIEENKKSKAIDIKEVNFQIEELKDKIKLAENNNYFYSNIDEDGVYYSEVSGVISSLSIENKLLTRDTILTKIAKIDGPTTFKYVAEFPVEKYEFVKSKAVIQIQKEYYDPKTDLYITEIDPIVRNGKMTLEASFPEDYERKLFIGDEIEGKIKERKKIKEYLTVSKSVLNPLGGFKEGNEATVFVVEERDGILGTELIARKKTVEMVVVGDHNVITRGLGGPKLRIITNPSYKIKDGSKVFLWD